MANVMTIRMTKRCKYCSWRIFDKVTPTTGMIEVKCPKCGRVQKIDLAFRMASKSAIKHEIAC